MLNIEHNKLTALTPSIALMRSLQVFNTQGNEIVWPPKSVMSLPLASIIKYLRGFAFKNLVNNQENSDIVFVVEDNTIHAHRALLYNRFPFFSAEFDPKLSKQEIIVKDTSYSLFILLLEVMVTTASVQC
jgi:hypothetical protein